MKVFVDSKRCHGHARCIAFAADVFGMDDEGFAHVIEGRENVPIDLEGNVRDACNNCPEGAVIVVED